MGRPINIWNNGFAMRRFFTCLFLLAWLTGCQTVARKVQPFSSASYHDIIEFTGRFSYRFFQGDKEQGVYGNFIWSQHKEIISIMLRSPFGQTLAMIRLSPGQAILQRPGQSPQMAKEADHLVWQFLGWSLPITGLQDWLQGVGIDHTGKTFIADPAQLQAAPFITMNEWSLTYPQWQGSIPRRIRLTKKTVQAGKIALDILIDQWRVP